MTVRARRLAAAGTVFRCRHSLSPHARSVVALAGSCSYDVPWQLPPWPWRRLRTGARERRRRCERHSRVASTDLGEFSLPPCLRHYDNKFSLSARALSPQSFSPPPPISALYLHLRPSSSIQPLSRKPPHYFNRQSALFLACGSVYIS